MQLPVLEVDGFKLPQTIAILRYIATINDMGPTDPLEVRFGSSPGLVMHPG